MSPRLWRRRLEDILESSANIQSYIEGASLETFVDDKKTVRAVAYEMVVIGEAVRQISPTVRQRFPQIPWAQMQAVRNVAVHEYFRLDPVILWETVSRHMPVVAAALREILAREL